MKVLLVLLIFSLNGCYLANGSPPDTDYWLKNGKKLSFKDNQNCGNQIFPNLGDRYIYLYKKRHQVGFIEFYKNKAESDEYNFYIEKAFRLLRQCYYDLGYRFRPPLYWCLAQDGDNTKICMENMKYRN
ncbi:hypothetical protein OA57_03495 [Chelonobacter oris]|uniref:Lipoprotein n=1 Tax=Chelonobacter oris TaxID=505317 RepID=A0A0A3APL7_9PAST|nr:hypothetical protein [Chelonobacter oris]KGQ71296.1 hypothetical protein OA57_03495 [Chelonobacter oris]